MSNPKLQASISMLEQSIMYLVDAYVSEGYSKEDAQREAALQLNTIQSRFAERGIVEKPVSLHTFSDPIKLVDDIVAAIEPLRQTTKLYHTGLLGKLKHLKEVLQKGGR